MTTKKVDEDFGVMCRLAALYQTGLWSQIARSWPAYLKLVGMTQRRFDAWMCVYNTVPGVQAHIDGHIKVQRHLAAFDVRIPMVTSENNQ